MIHSNRMFVIGAQTSDDAFGFGNGMPWPRGTVRQDMSHFKRKTMEAPPGKINLLIVGRETFEAMERKALPGRYMVVVSRKFESVGLTGDRVFCAPSIEAFLLQRAEKIEDLHHIFFIGREFIWREGFKYSSNAHITVVKREVENKEGLKRLKTPLTKQATDSGFIQLRNETVTDDWDGPVQIEFLHYFKPLIRCD